MNYRFLLPQTRLVAWLAVAFVFGSLVIGGHIVNAGPLTGGAGNPPYAKLSVYQGVVAIAPAANQRMTLGENGNTIRTEGNIYLLPTNDAVTVAAQNSSFEGGQLVIQPPAGWPVPLWNIDNYVDNRGTTTPTDDISELRLFVDTTERLVIRQDSSVEVKGSLCLNATGCKTELIGSGTPGEQTLDQVLTTGNTSTRRLMLGVYDGNYGPSSGDSTGYVDINHSMMNTWWYGVPVAQNGISAKSGFGLAALNGSAVYAENNVGFAAYFRGIVGNYATGTAPSDYGFAAGSLYQVGANIAPGNGYALDVYNADPRGMAATFLGNVIINGSGAGGTEPEAALLVRNTNPAGYGVTVKVSGAYDSYGLRAKGGNATAGNTTYAVYGEMGTATNGAESYAGLFRDHAYFSPGLIIRPYGGSTPWGLQFNGGSIYKQSTQTQVCDLNANNCYGKFLQMTCGATNKICATVAEAQDKANLRYYYEDKSSGTVTYKSVYSAGTRMFEIR